MSDANEPDPVSNANEPDPVSDANEPDPVSDANEPDPVLRVEVVRGGDPGDAVLAAVATVLTRPVVVTAPVEEAQEPAAATPRWVRAARLEGVVPGRRISSIGDLDWRRGA